MFIAKNNGLHRPVAEDVRKLRALADDLERLAAGQGPNAADLANAARVDGYEIITRPVPALYGLNSGHPSLVSETLQTTQLWVLNTTEGWARTYSRFYRLGQPLKEALNVKQATWIRDTD